VLTGDERYLDLRTFKDKVKKAIWEKQNHKCAICGKEFDFELMEGDHIKPWREGGKNYISNCQMLRRTCNRSKGSK
jgi:5-methylcytosine-specific restriction endonuclease McrA